MYTFIQKFSSNYNDYNNLKLKKMFHIGVAVAAQLA